MQGWIPLLYLLVGTTVQGASWSVMKNDNHYVVVKGIQKDAFATGSLENTTATDGWYRLQITSNPLKTDNEQSSAAGFLEGWLTQPLIDDYTINMESMWSNITLRDLVDDWLKEWYEWMQEMVTSNPKEGYWRLAGALLAQFDGVFDGYNAYCKQNGCSSRSFADFLRLTPSVEDIAKAVAPGALGAPPNIGHCSALFVSMPHSHFCTGHTTWGLYIAMLRVYKTYTLALSDAVNPVIGFSSYPGFVFSGDDWLLAPKHQLVVTETTFNVFDTSLYQKLTPHSVLTWARSMIATRYATSPKKWTDTFALYNSGSYNSQWMAFQEGTLWIAEQAPGMVHVWDATSTFQQQGYWPSYNIPYQEDVYVLLGYPEAKKEKGNEYDYQLASRAQIFKRNVTMVESEESMKQLMRYNNYQQDPLSLGDPTKAVSSRFDLVPGSHAFPMGGTDSKVACDADILQGVCWAAAGPTHDQLPVFTWKEFEEWSHKGVPSSFPFGWTAMP